MLYQDNSRIMQFIWPPRSPGLVRPPGAASANTSTASFASGFQRCHVPVHKDNILAGFGRTRMELIVIEKERSRSRRKREDEIRDSAGWVSFLQ